MYAYCLNNPVNFYDGDGSFAIALTATLAEFLLGAGATAVFVELLWDIGCNLCEIISDFSQSVSEARTEAKDKAAVISDAIVDTSNGAKRIYTVYLLCATGDSYQRIVYVGRVKTANHDARMSYHKARGRKEVQHFSDLTWEECRGLEQYLMLYYHTIKKGNPLYNQIRGVSQQNRNGPQYYLAAKEYIQNQMENELLNLWM